MVHPNILPQSLVEGASEPPAPRPPRVEYLATLSRHSAAVNVVRFSPNGQCEAYHTRLVDADTRRRRPNRVRWRWYVGGYIIYMRYHLSAYPVDGMIIIWSPTTSPHASSYGSDLAPEDLQYEKEHWKPRTTFRYEC